MLKKKIETPPAVARGRAPNRDHEALHQLALVLTGSGRAALEIPALSELGAAAVSLASGRRHKALLPLAATPTEFALVRSGDRVRIDHYGTDTVPEILLRNREIPLQQLLDACARSGRALAETESDPAVAKTLLRVAARADNARLRADPHRKLDPVRVTAGAIGDPGSHIPLAFGFDVSILPSVDTPHDAHFFADVHALLFEGELWAFSRGRRIPLWQGPIMLAVQRMVAAVRALIDAWQADKPMNVRLRSDSFLIGMRLDHKGSVAVTLGCEGREALTLPALDVPGAALPILRLASDLSRAFISADRVQSRNLRVSALRNEVRALRRLIRARNQLDGFENTDPDRLRFSSPEPDEDLEQRPALGRAQPGRLRFSERWSAEIDGLNRAGCVSPSAGAPRSTDWIRPLPFSAATAWCWPPPR
jgi:hypothetical protein